MLKYCFFHLGYICPGGILKSPKLGPVELFENATDLK